MSDASDRWARVDALCQAALEVPETERVAFLSSACDDPNVRREAQALLAYAFRAERFLEAPLAATMGSVLPASRGSLTGSRLGVFEIGPFLGAGGMGEVYRARDTRLSRDVALKILPLTSALAADRLERFRREAQALAALNHQNIGAIYGLEESNGVHALVLELVEGQTLADRLDAGPIPLDEAIAIGRQIAEGLESAHERGIVHNDLKPQNITLRPDGAVKVLDFGVATVMQSMHDALEPGPQASGAVSPVFGTRAYASPEQLKGVSDKRSDIWAFGAVLYEILSGKQPFGAHGWGASTANVDRSVLPATTPDTVRRLIERCLEPDARRRLRDVGEARIVLEDRSLFARPASDSIVPSHSDPRGRRAWSLRIAAVAATLGGAVWAGTLLTREHIPSVAHLSVLVPAGQSLSTGDRRIAAVSPDGAQVVYVAAPAGLYLRSLPAPEARPIPGADAHGNIGEPVFSPDGQSVLFHALGDRTLRRIPVSGGAAVIVCPAVFPYGVSWTDEGIVFVEPGRGIVRVPLAGGPPEVIVALASDRAAQSPQLLPGGRVLYTVATGTGPDRWDRARIVLRMLRSGEEVTLVEGGSDARYVPTGHLLYAVGGNLFAVPFDLSRVRTGVASPVIQGVRRGAPAVTGTAQFDVARNGTLMYVPGAESAGWDLAVTDRKGAVERLDLPSGLYEAPRASPDGRRIAFGTDDGKEAIVWVYDLDRGAPARRLTFGGNARFPVWSRDGTRVAFQFDAEGDAAIFWQAIDGRPAERLTRPAEGDVHEPEAWAPSGDDLVFSSTTANEVTLRVLSLKTLTVSRFSDVRSSTRTGAVFHPDGRWLAYARSDPSGKTIYVEPFPATGAKYQLAMAGASQPNHPLWSPHGTELFYNPGPGRFESVPVTTAPTFAFGSPAAVPRFFPGASTRMRRPFDVLPDGRFVSPVAAGAPSSNVGSPQEIRVVLNWFTELSADRR